MVESVEEDTLNVDVDSFEDGEVLRCRKIKVVPLRSVDERQAAFDSRSLIGNDIGRVRIAVGLNELRIYDVDLGRIWCRTSYTNRFLDVFRRNAEEIDTAV
jgi:hypothetical protein